MARGIGRRLSFKEEVILDHLIQQNATISKAPLAKNRVVVYNDDWNDQRVLDALNEQTRLDFGISSVQRFRSIHIGQLPRAGGSAKPNSRTMPISAAIARLTHRNSVLEERVARIERYLTEQHGYEVETDNGIAIRVQDLTNQK